MDLNLREAVVRRVQGKSSDELKQVIEGSIGGDDSALPGLGVLFEKIWEHSKPELRNELAASLKESLDSHQNVSLQGKTS